MPVSRQRSFRKDTAHAQTFVQANNRIGDQSSNHGIVRKLNSDLIYYARHSVLTSTGGLAGSNACVTWQCLQNSVIAAAHWGVIGCKCSG